MNGLVLEWLQAGLIVAICFGIQTNQIGQSEWYGILLSEIKVQFKVALALFLLLSHDTHIYWLIPPSASRNRVNSHFLKVVQCQPRPNHKTQSFSIKASTQ